MGHQISAGGNGVYFTDGAWQVIDWCETFTPVEKSDNLDDWIGVSWASVEAVKLANERVPSTYDECMASGLLRKGRNGRYLDIQSWEECRTFLRFAANGGHEITGSW